MICSECEQVHGCYLLDHAEKLFAFEDAWDLYKTFYSFTKSMEDFSVIGKIKFRDKFITLIKVKEFLQLILHCELPKDSNLISNVAASLSMKTYSLKQHVTCFHEIKLPSHSDINKILTTCNNSSNTPSVAAIDALTEYS